MTTYRYTDETNTVVHVIDDDGISRMSMLASALSPEAEILPFVPPPPPIPSSVTPRQARLALLGAGLLAQVDAAIAAMEEPQRSAVQIEWEYATAVERASPWVSGLGSALGLDDAALDQLFITAVAL